MRTDKHINKSGYQKIAKARWYRQGVAMRPFYIGFPWHTCLSFTYRGHQSGLSYKSFGVYLKQDFFDAYFPIKAFEKVANFYYTKEIKKPGHAARLKYRWEMQYVKPLQKKITELEQANFSNFSRAELLTAFKEFSAVYIAFWREAIFLDAFDVMSDVILERALEQEKRQPSAEQLQALTSPTHFSWLQREKIQLLALVDYAKKNRMLWRTLYQGKMKPAAFNRYFPRFVAKLQRHSDSFHWLYNDFAVIRRLDWQYFVKQVNGFAQDYVSYKKEKSSLEQINKVVDIKNRTIKRLQLTPKFVTTIKFLVTLAEWRDWRKAYTQKTSSLLKLFSREFIVRKGWSREEFEYLWWWEVKDIFRLSGSLRRVVRRRRQGMFVFDDAARADRVTYGPAALKLGTFMNKLIKREGKLVGRPAYNGVVRGPARIIRTQKDFRKMRPGDILIAPNTRPEYVPIMKLASAIVSEEGGLTCHTAIVARELKIPAVVGIQGIISVLKDGDRVEVDAMKGTVRKI